MGGLAVGTVQNPVSLSGVLRLVHPESGGSALHALYALHTGRGSEDGRHVGHLEVMP